MKNKKGLAASDGAGSESQERSGMTIQLSVSELMALRNAAAKGGLIDYREVRDVIKDKLCGLGLVERRNDVVTDKAKLADAIKANREALAIPKPAPGDYLALQKFREVLYACCERLRSVRHSGLFLTDLGKRYASLNVTIALPGSRKPATAPPSASNLTPQSSPKTKDPQ
jgi:hypothetical protein